MSTARLTWLVLDRLVPTDEEAYARAALIARDPELRSLVDQGIITEDQAIGTLRARARRLRDPDDSIIWIRQPLAAALVLVFVLFVAVSLLA
ncbi:MAG: hypothetical protein AB1679_07205 [Actinomycetota bacterium]